MNRTVILDTGPLGKITHPRSNPEIAEWLQQLVRSDINVIVPEISDYELRRNLLLEGLTKSISRLNALKNKLTYLPLTTEVMLKAAKLWASARKHGKPTADPKELDCDVILAAQAISMGAIIATENVGHLSLFAEAKNWKEIT